MNDKKIESLWKEILELIGEDTEREGIKATPKRIARMYKNIFYGYNKKLVVMNEEERSKNNEKDIIPITIFKNENKEMLIRDTVFTSFCEHHIVPFSGKAWVGIIPDKKLLGMNKIDKIVKYFAARLQIQERMTQQIADWIWENIEPLGIIVIIRADHFCARLQNDNGWFTTSAIKGVFKKNEPKNEFLKLMELK